MKETRIREKLLRNLIANPTNAEAIEEALADTRTRAALEYLAAKGYVNAQRAWGGQIISVSLTDLGRTYFEDKAERRRIRWADRVLGFFVGVLTTVAGELILRLIAG